MPTYCPDCDASNPRTAAVCVECGRRLAPAAAARPQAGSRAARPVVRHSRRGGSRSSTASTTIWVWSVAGVVLLAAAAFFATRGSPAEAAPSGPETPAANTDGPASPVRKSEPRPLVRRTTPRAYPAPIRATLSGPDAFLRLPHARVAADALSGLVAQSDKAGLLELLPRRLRWPLEVDFAATPERTAIVVLRMPGPSRVVLPWLEEVMGVASTERSFDGGDLGYMSLGPLGSVFEAVIDGRVHCAIVVGRGTGAAQWLTAHFGAVPELAAEEQPLWDRLGGCEGRLLVSLNGLAQMLSAGERTQMEAMLKLIAGPGLAGLSVGLRQERGRIVVDGHSDLSTRTGLLGSLFRAESAPRLLGWIHEDASEFLCAALDPDAVARLGRLPMIAQSLDAETRELLGTVSDFAERHWDGQIAVLSKPSGVADLRDAGASSPMVVVLGVDDGPAVLEEMPFLTPATDLAITAAAPPRALRDESGAVVFHVVAGEDVIFFSGADSESVALLRRSLATGGKADGPRRFGELMGGAMPAGCDVIAHSTVLSDLVGRVAMRELAGRSSELPPAFERDPRLEQLAAADYAVWFAVDEKGTRFQTRY